MRAATVFSVAALLGSALAAPGGWKDWDENNGAPVANYQQGPAQDVEVVTVYQTITVAGKKPQQAQATPAPAPAAQQTWQSAKPAASQAVAAPVDNDGSWQSVVAEWRSKMGLAALEPDSTLEANAMKTAVDGNGQMEHQLNPGSMGQVLAPGSPSEFVSVFVGGWLCELPDDLGMNGICASASNGWSHDGQTGHAEILRGNWKKIGCACATGIWACDVA